MNFSVKQARLLSGLTQKEMAEKLGVHRLTYSKWENQPDEIPIGKAMIFSNVVKVPINHIFFADKSTLSLQNNFDDDLLPQIMERR